MRMCVCVCVCVCVSLVQTTNALFALQNTSRLIVAQIC